jgi:exopolysaccharide production protein ExoQ
MTHNTFSIQRKVAVSKRPEWDCSIGHTQITVATIQCNASGMTKSTHSPGKHKLADADFTVGAPVAIIPLLTLSYALLILPFMIDADGQGRPFNNLFWPTAAALTLALALKNKSLIDGKFVRSLPIMSLIAYLLFAVASVSWAYSPEHSFSRVAVHILICIVVLVPYALPIRMTYTIPILQICYTAALAISAFYVLTYPPTPIGHTGYFLHKQDLGLLGAVAVVVSAHELLFGRWWRRIIAVVSCSLAIWLIIESQSKSALIFAFVSLACSWLVLIACKMLRATPAYIVGAFVVAASFISNPIERIGYRLYGDATLTGRTGIWQFIEYQISHKSWFGWGFHSYFFVPNSPHAAAPGYIADMPSSHSGFLELRLETGRIGYWIFLFFIYASLHLVERVRRRDAARAWFYLSVILFALLINLTDSYWFVLNHFWLLYLIIIGETIRYAQSTGLSQSAQPASKRMGRRMSRTARAEGSRAHARPALGG